MILTPKAQRHLATLVTLAGVHSTSGLTARNLYNHVVYLHDGLRPENVTWLYNHVSRGVNRMGDKHPSFEKHHRMAAGAYRGLLNFLSNHSLVLGAIIKPVYGQMERSSVN